MGVGMCELFIFPFGVAISPGVLTGQGALHADLPTLFPLSTWAKTTTLPKVKNVRTVRVRTGGMNA